MARGRGARHHDALAGSSVAEHLIVDQTRAGSNPARPALTDVARVAVVQPSVADVVGGRSLTPPVVVFHGQPGAPALASGLQSARPPMLPVEGMGYPPVKGNTASLGRGIRSSPVSFKGEDDMAINIGQRSSSLGSGKVEYQPDHPIVHFGSPSPGRAAKKRALEDLYGGEVPDSTADRVIMRDADEPDRTHPFVD